MAKSAILPYLNFPNYPAYCGLLPFVPMPPALKKKSPSRDSTELVEVSSRPLRLKKYSIRFPQTHRRTNNFRENINRSQRRPAREKKLPDGGRGDRRRRSCRDSRRGLRFMCHGSRRQRWGGRKRNRRHAALGCREMAYCAWSAAHGRRTLGILPIDWLPTRPPSLRRPGRRARRRRLTLLVPTREEGDQRADD